MADDDFVRVFNKVLFGTACVFVFVRVALFDWRIIVATAAVLVGCYLVTCGLTRRG